MQYGVHHYFAIQGMRKDAGTPRQVKLRGLDRVEMLFTLAATVVNLRRLPKLLAPQPSGQQIHGIGAP